MLKSQFACVSQISKNEVLLFSFRSSILTMKWLGIVKDMAFEVG